MSRPLLNAAAVRAGTTVGLVLAAVVVVLVAVLDVALDDLSGSPWLYLPFTLLLVGFAAAGLAAGRVAGDTPLRNGAVAALLTFAGWLLGSALARLLRDDDLDVDGTSLLATALFAAAFGLAGALLGARGASDAVERDNGDGGEPAGRPRTELHPSEERPDSAGQGAG